MVYVDVKQHCESRGGCPGLPVPNKPYGLCGRKATLNSNFATVRAQELCESRAGRPGLHVPNNSCGLCGRKAPLNESSSSSTAMNERFGARPAEAYRDELWYEDSCAPTVGLYSRYG